MKPPKFQQWTWKLSERISFERRDLKKAVAILLLGILPLLYGAGYLAQFLKNYKIWSAAGGVAGDGTAPQFPDAGILSCFRHVFSMDGFYALLFECILIAILVVMVMHMGNSTGGELDRERNFAYSEKGTYGTAGYLEQKEMKKLLCLTDIRHTKGTILGIVEKQIASIPLESRMNRNIAVYGASGSMKSRAFVRNMIFQCVRRGESMVLTDPKSELYEDMSVYLEEHGYTIKVFNLVNPPNSDSWNCMWEIQHEELMAQTCADVIIKNTSDGKTDHFWDMSELNLLKALILYVDMEKTEEERNLGQVYRMLAELSEKEMDARFALLPKEHPAKGPYHIFKQAGEKVRGGVIIGLGARLQVFQNKMIRNITAYPEIDLELPGKEKCAYFCITSDQDSTFDFLSSLFFSFLFIKLVRFADRNGVDGKLPKAVNFILDEFPNIGAIPDFKKKISTVRSRNISISVIFQNIAQLKNRYPYDEWQEIIGNCDTQIALGCTDEMTARFLSDRTGEVTISVSSQSKQLHTWRVSNFTPDFRETSSVGRRKLMTQDEVLRMPLDEALIILRGQKVFRVKKFDYTLHPESKKLKKRKAVTHIPLWQMEEKEPAVKIEEPKQQMALSEERKESFRQEIKSAVSEQEVQPKEPKKVVSISKKQLMSKNKEARNNGQGGKNDTGAADAGIDH